MRKLLLAMLLYTGVLVNVADGFIEYVDTSNKFKAELKSDFDFKNAKTLEQTINVGENIFIHKINNDIEQKNEEIKARQKKIQVEKAKARKVEENRRVIDVELSFYCSCSICCNEYASLNPGITASGTKAKFGTIAAPKELKFGTQMKFKSFGDKIFTCEDRGGAIIKTGNIYKMDVYVDNHSEAMSRGRYKDKAIIIN